MMSNKIAVIGDKESILIFKGVGFKVFPVEGDQEKVPSLIKRLCQDGYAIIFITEEYRKKFASMIKEMISQSLPSIVAIPSHRGGMGIGKTMIQEMIKKATGTDLFKEF